MVVTRKTNGETRLLGGLRLQLARLVVASVSLLGLADRDTVCLIGQRPPLATDRHNASPMVSLTAPSLVFEVLELLNPPDGDWFLHARWLAKFVCPSKIRGCADWLRRGSSLAWPIPARARNLRRDTEAQRHARRRDTGSAQETRSRSTCSASLRLPAAVSFHACCKASQGSGHQKCEATFGPFRFLCLTAFRSQPSD